MPYISGESGPFKGKLYDVGRGLVIGSDDSCDVKVESGGVGKFHAQIFKREGGFHIRDLGHTIGTYVTCRRIKEIELSDRDIIEIGSLKFIFNKGDLLPGQADNVPSRRKTQVPGTKKKKTPEKAPAVVPSTAVKEPPEPEPVNKTVTAQQKIDQISASGETDTGMELKVATGRRKGNRFPFTGKTIIGRDQACDLRINEPDVSRVHAAITFEEGGFYVKDLDSQNGTSVNFEPIHEKTEIFENDVITLGFTSIEFIKARGDSPQKREWGDVRKTRETPEASSVDEPEEDSTTFVLEEHDASSLELPGPKLDEATYVLSSNSRRQTYYLELITSNINLEGVSDDNEENFLAALREGIGNAARHGNKYDEKKNIVVRFEKKPGLLKAEITDQGEGFDHEAYVARMKTKSAVDAARERIIEGGQGGIGLILIQKTVDRFYYNEKGNSLTIEKNF